MLSARCDASKVMWTRFIAGGARVGWWNSKGLVAVEVVEQQE